MARFESTCCNWPGASAATSLCFCAATSATAAFGEGAAAQPSEADTTMNAIHATTEVLLDIAFPRLSSLRMHKPDDPDTHKIQNDHGRRKNAHVKDVSGGREK